MTEEQYKQMWKATVEDAQRVRDASFILYMNAIGQTSHTYMGLCPDPLEGPETRDPECGVCRALDEFERIV